MSRKIKVPKENRRVSTAGQRPSSQKFVSVSDNLNAWIDEVVANSPSEVSQALNDTLNLSDAAAFQINAILALADSVLIGDQFLLGFGVGVNDSFSQSDSIVVVQGLTLPLSDNALNLNDALETSAVGNLTQESAETLSQSDTLAIGYGLLPEDSNNLSDAFLANADHLLPVGDFFFPPMIEGDIAVIPHGAAFAVERADFMEQFDALSLFAAGFQSFSDSFSLADAYTALGAGFMSLADSISQSDAVSVLMNYRLTLTDNLDTLTDGVASRGQIWEAGISESLSQSDAFSYSNATINQSIVVADSVNNWSDAVIAKCPRWKDAITVVRGNAFADVPQAVSDTLPGMAETLASARVQFARPVSDVSVGLWSTTPLFNKIDETTIDDTDLIISATNPVNDTCECALTAATDPTSSVNHVLRYRYKKSANAGRTIDLTVTLRQGANAIATFTHTNIGSTITQADQTLSGAQADAITNYGDLRVRFVANVSGSGSGRAAHITWALFECPK